jgi:hypothetical protein
MTFLEYLYDCQRISAVDADFLEDSIESFQGFSDILDKPNVFIIEEVRKETQRLQSKLTENYRWYKQKLRNKNDPKIELIEELNNKIFYLIKTMKSKEINYHGELYESILECVNLFSAEYENLKSPIERLMYDGFKRKKPKTTDNLDTDKIIIASAFSRALAENKDVSIISNDGRMTEKFSIAYNLISCDELYYGLTELREHNLSFYKINRGGEIITVKKTKDMEPMSKFVFPEVDPVYNKNLRYTVDEMLYRGQPDKILSNILTKKDINH